MNENILNKPYNRKQYADFICINQGLNRYEDDNCIIMYNNSEIIVNGEAVSNPNYEQEQKAQAKKMIVKEYSEYFKELDRICGAKFARGLCTTNQIDAQRASLQSELNQKIQEIDNG